MADDQIMRNDNLTPDSDDEHQSPDDALQPPDDIYNPHVDEEVLPEDNDSPAAPDPTNAHNIPPDHPITDSNLEDEEVYGEGIGRATGVDENEILPGDNPMPLEPEDDDENQNK